MPLVGRHPARLFAALVVVAALAVAGAARPAAAGPGPTSGASSQPAPVWAPCPDGPQLDCARYPVPLDYGQPDGTSTPLFLTRRRAGTPAHRIGTLFVNPGGPGDAGAYLARFAGQVFRPEVLDRFDVVGFDPRGVGGSAPIACFAGNGAFRLVLGHVPSVPIGPLRVQKTIEAYGHYSQACGAHAGPLLAHMSTLDVARDLDRLRAAVGDRQLSYVGYSYGTQLGATYANLFPDRVRAMVLDGMVDPRQRTQDRLANKFDRAGGFELALDAFLAACERAGGQCALVGGAGPRYKFTRMREALRLTPIAYRGKDVTIDAFTTTVARSLYGLAGLRPLADLLSSFWVDAFRSEALAAEPGLTARRPTADVRGFLTAPSTTPLGDGYGYNATDAFFAVNCLDAPLPRTPAAYPAIAELFESAHRTFGRAEAFSELPCASWPVRTDERYAGPWDRPTSHALLIVNATFDPATRYLFAERAEGELGNARLLTLAGYGHTSQASRCVENAVTRYLIAGDLPAPGATCQQDVAPFAPEASGVRAVAGPGS